MQDAIDTRSSIGRAQDANSREIMRQSKLKIANTSETSARSPLGAVGGPSTSLDSLFLSVITASAPLIGKAYFEKVPRLIVDAWGGVAFLTRVDRNGSCRLLGITGLDQQTPPAALSGQPWLGDETTSAIYYPSRAARLFPGDALLAGIETFFAVPLFDSGGRRVGYVGMLDKDAWSANKAATAESLLRLIAPRAAAEVEREQLQERLTVELRNFAELATETDDGFLSWIAEEPPRLVYANHSAARILGRQEHELASDPQILSDMLAAVEDEPAIGPRIGVLHVRREGGFDGMVEFRLTVDLECSDGPMYRCIMRDVDQRRDEQGADDALLGVVLRQLPFAAVAVCDDEVIFMNARASEVTGSTREELLNQAVAITDHGRTVSLTLREFARRALTSSSPTRKVTLKPRRGRERFIEMRTTVITVRGRTGLILAPLDLTREHATESRLRMRADLSTRILQSLPVDVVVIDAEGRVVALSDPENQFARWTRDIALCRPALQLGDDYVAMCRERANGHDEFARQALHGVGSVLSGSVPHFVMEYDGADREGRSNALLMSATPLSGGGAIVAHSNITPLKQNERRLAGEEARQRELLGHLPDQLARVSSDGRVLEVWMPGHMSRMVPPLPRAPMARSVEELLPDGAAERFATAIHDALQSNTVVTCLVTVPYEGDEREYEMRVVPLPAHDALVYVRDRTADQWTANARTVGEGATERQRILRENPYGLTFREAAVLELMAQGAADKEIAAALGVSVFTIYKHVSKILHKMNAVSRTEASLRTVREHLFA